MNKQKVLGMGNALVDMMVELPDDSVLAELDLPRGCMQLVDKEFSNLAKEKVRHMKRIEKSGGSAANTICGLASMGIDTAFIGKIGNDPLGKVFHDDLERCGTKPLLKYGRGETGLALALVSPDSERTFATHLGASIEMEPSDLDAAMFRGYDYFYIEGYLVQHHELIRRAVELAKEAGLDVILDMASYNVVEYNLEFLQFLVREYADVVFANEEEARVYTNGKNPEAALAEIAGDCWIAVVKTGKSGSLVQNAKQVYRIEAENANCIDTTGAGDLYAAGFIYGLIHNMSLPECGKIGSVMAAKVIENMGAKIPEKEWPGLRNTISSIMEASSKQDK